MNLIYTHHYNINLGLLNYLHPFDGMKFQTIYKGLKNNSAIQWQAPPAEITMDIVDEYVSSIMSKKLRDSVFIFRALEVPKIPFISYNFLNNKILSPMRWGVAGTIYGAELALKNKDIYWNLSGGYHHATRQNMEGFCIFNDVGICYQELIKTKQLNEKDKILIIDTDAHHGNGNAYEFMENPAATLLDIYNSDIYPLSEYSRSGVDISVKLASGTEGATYLTRYQNALEQIDDNYALAFVIAGTDTLISDKLGRLCLTIDDVAQREKITFDALKKRNIPSVFLGGGGYSKESAQSVIQAITRCTQK